MHLRKQIAFLTFFSFVAIQNCDLVCAVPDIIGSWTNDRKTNISHCGQGKPVGQASTHCAGTNNDKKNHDNDSCGCSRLYGNPGITSAAQFLVRPPLARSLAPSPYLLPTQNPILRHQNSNITEHGPPLTAGSEVLLSFRSPRAPPLQSL